MILLQKFLKLTTVGDGTDVVLAVEPISPGRAAANSLGRSFRLWLFYYVRKLLSVYFQV